jgi:anti-anti-sigma factor
VAVAAASEAIRRRLDREYLVVWPPDELDAETVPAFRERLLAIDPNTEVVVDLRELRFCGSEGVSLFLDAQRHLAERGSSLTLSFPPPSFERLLAVCGLDGHFKVRRPFKRKRSSRGGADPQRR